MIMWTSSMSGGLSCLITALLIANLSYKAASDSTLFNFTITNFTSSDVVIQGRTAFQNGSLLLTNGSGHAAADYSYMSRAVYPTKVQFHNSTSNQSASFSTSFDFAIIPQYQESQKGDGMTFIIAPTDEIPSTPDSAGGNLAMYDVIKYNATDPKIHVVAVEFDTFSYASAFDPPGDHVGLDINSYKSVKAQTLPPPFQPLNTSNAADRRTAWIEYDAVAGRLDVYLATTPTKRSNATLVLSYSPLCLSQYVLNNSYVGFTAATGFWSEVHFISNWEFSSTLVSSAIGPSSVPLIYPDYSVTETGSGGSKSKRTGLIAGVTVASVIVVLLFLVLVAVLELQRRRRIAALGLQLDNLDWLETFEADVANGPRKFSYKELKDATNNFSSQQLLGQGGFGSVYKGMITSKDPQSTPIHIAVKRVSETSKQGEREFKAEVLSIGRLRHRNLVPLYGWCHEQGELLLVYEFMRNGSLDQRLYDPKSVLNWEYRYNILAGVASALIYLHVEWEKRILHRDIKASNVLLDSGFNARLGDFGLARLVDHKKGDQSVTSTAVAGTWGYLAPEYAISGKTTMESDIYSFGVLCLVVATGRRPYVPLSGSEDDHEYLVDWVWSRVEAGNLQEIADKQLGSDYDEQQLKRLVHVGLLCTHPDPKARLPTKSLIAALIGERDLLPFQAARPVAVYFSNLKPSQTSFTADSDSIFRKIEDSSIFRQIVEEPTPPPESPDGPRAMQRLIAEHTKGSRPPTDLSSSSVDSEPATSEHSSSSHERGSPPFFPLNKVAGPPQSLTVPR